MAGFRRVPWREEVHVARAAIALLVAGILLVSSVSDAHECLISINTSGTDQSAPALHGDLIAWQDARHGNATIYLYRMDTGNEARITTDPFEHTRPAVGGPLVAWEDNPGISFARISDPAAITQISTSGYTPAISGNWIAWSDDRFGDWDILLHHVATGENETVAAGFGDQTFPAISGNNVVWMSTVDYASYDIFFGTSGGAATQVTSGFANPFSGPAIDEDRIVWADTRNGDSDIYLYNITSSDEIQITTNSSDQLAPSISGDRIVWEDMRNGNADIYLYNLSTGIESRITSDSHDQRIPKISGDLVVWYDKRTPPGDIYLLNLSSSDPCPSVSFSAIPSSGMRHLTVQFTDTSSTNATHTHWFWDFGDGNVSYEREPRHTYVADGIYTVTLTVSNPAGRDLLSKPDLIRVGEVPVASFTADQLYGIRPFQVRFTDTSSGDPGEWTWDFGDGNSTRGITADHQNPVYTYTVPGTYTVNLSASNANGTGTKSMTEYIRVLNGKNLSATTDIHGLDITTVGGLHQITLDTSQVDSWSFDPSVDATRLAFTPPASKGWRLITLFADDGTGFTEFPPGIITGRLTACSLESQDIIPATFVTDVGNNLPVSYRLDMKAFPANAAINATLWEGVMPSDDTAFTRALMGSGGNFSHLLDTAYTIDFVSKNISAANVTDAILNLSVSADWVRKYGNENNITVVRLGNDLVNQTLDPTATSTDASGFVDFFTVPSPRGLSRFGLVSGTGSSNILQMGAQAAQKYIGGIGAGSSDKPAVKDRTPWEQPTVAAKPPERPAVTYYREGKVDTTVAGITRESVIVSSEDRGMNILIPEGTEALDAAKAPLTRVSVNPTAPGEAPSFAVAGDSRFTGIVYTVGPDGASFNPPATITFTIPGAAWAEGTRYTIRTYDPVTASWADIPTTVDPATRTLTGTVYHLCLFGVFSAPEPAAAQVTLPAAAPAATPEPAAVPRTPMGTFSGMLAWAYALVTGHLLASALILAVAILLSAAFIARRRRSRVTRITRKK